MLAQLVALRSRFHPLHRLRQSRVAAAALAVLDRPVTMRLADIAWPVRVRLVRHAAYILNARMVEPGEQALFIVLCRALRPVVFWDVGANIGLYSWICLTVDPAARAVLFEPDPDNLRLLAVTCGAAGGRAETIPAAVSSQDGEALFLADPRTGHRGAIASSGGDASGLTVATVALDSLVAAGRPPPALIKMDIEGAELAALQGAERLLREHRPVILLEAFDGAVGAACSHLAQRGYVLFNAERPTDDMTSNNFLAVPASRAGEFAGWRELWKAELRARRLPDA
jgi:FkbM family methyltransferase